MAANHGIPNEEQITQQLALTTRVMKYNPDPARVQRQIYYLALANRTGEAIDLLRQASISYATYIPAYICFWTVLADERLKPIIEEGNRIWNQDLHCKQDGNPVNYRPLRPFM